MRNLKRFLAMTITMLMVVGCFAFSSTAAFDDVVDYQKQIDLMNLLGIVQGYDEDNFGYGEDVARWHMALWIAKIMTGKVDDAYVNFYSTMNYTAFNDISVDQFFGSISYCNDNNVIIGTSPTTFEPAKGIMIQDVFTMVVRMLGYGSSSMDARYPWSYIDMAIKLGLDNGLVADYNNEDVATREQAAVILYNALFTPKADGTTFAESKFNLTIDTVVITGTSRANMFATGEEVITKTVAGVNYVGFNRLGADGNIIPNPTYYLPKTAFGLGDVDENYYFGQSFKVVTRNNFESLIYVEMIDSVVLDQTQFEGTNAAGSVALTIEGKAYRAVPGYTKLYNNQDSKTTNNFEVIVFDKTGTYTISGTGSYLMDKDLNILDVTGNILLYYFGNSVTKPGGIYLYKIADGTYIEPDDTIWDRAARVDTITKLGMVKLTSAGWNAQSVFLKNAYSDTVLYDDNGDGIYDRAFYTRYDFGLLSYDGNGYITMNGALLNGNMAYTNVVYVNADTLEKIAAADIMKPLDSALAKGNYVLYSYNAALNYMFIKEVFSPKIGLVTGYNKAAATITFDAVYYNIHQGNVAGITLGVGNSRLNGATYGEIVGRVDVEKLQGKVVHYIEKDGKMLAIYLTGTEAGAGKGYIVVDDVVGVTTTGYLQLLVYNSNNIKSVITVNRIDGAWYANHLGWTYSYASNYRDLYKGKLYIGTQDALGNWDLETVRDDKDYTYYFRNKIGSYSYNYCYNKTKTIDFNVRLGFKNGIAIPMIWWDVLDGVNDFMAFESANGTAKKFEQFKADANTVFILLDQTGGVLTAAKGIPQDGSFIDIYKSTFNNDVQIYVVQSGDPSIASFVYIKYGEFKSFKTNSGWNNTAASTIIFIDKDTKATEAYTNQSTNGLGVTMGAVYTYSNAVDVIRGGLYTGSIQVFNHQLKVGSFYRVVDGYVQEEIEPGNDSSIRVGNLEFIDTYEYVLTTAKGQVITENYTTNYVYELVGNDITNTSATDVTPANKRAAVGAAINGIIGEYAAVYYYAGYEYTGTGLTNDDYDTDARVFIYTALKGNATQPSSAFSAIGSRYNRVWLTPPQPQYIKTELASGAEVFSYYQIPYEAYVAISSGGYLPNDIYNDYADYNLGTICRMYDSAGKLIADFNEDNVLMLTKMFVTNGSGTQYYLIFTAKPTWKQADITAVGAVKLVWTNPENINDTYTLTLPSLGIKGCHPVVSVLDTKKASEDFYSLYNSTGGVMLFTNVYNVADMADAIWNIKSWKVFGENRKVPTQLSFGGAFGFKTDYKEPIKKLDVDQGIISWNGKDVYVVVPKIAGHTAKVEFYYTFNESHWSWDGTNGAVKFWNFKWDVLFLGQDWHHNIVWDTAALATSTAYTNLSSSYNQSASLHPDLYDVYVVPVGIYGVVVRVTYTKIVTPEPPPPPTQYDIIASVNSQGTKFSLYVAGAIKDHGDWHSNVAVAGRNKAEAGQQIVLNVANAEDMTGIFVERYIDNPLVPTIGVDFDYLLLSDGSVNIIFTMPADNVVITILWDTAGTGIR